MISTQDITSSDPVAKAWADGHAAGVKEGYAKAAADYEERIAQLMEQAAISNARYWGASSDKVKGKEISVFNDAEAASNDEPEPPALSPGQKPKERSRGRRKAGTRALDLSRLPVVIVEHELVGDEAICHVCGTGLKELKVEVTDKVRYIPAHFEVERHRRHVGICPVCSSANAKGEETGTVIVRAQMAPPLLKGSIATPSLVAGVIYEKHVNSLPLYRIECDFRRKGLKLPRSVTANWMIKAGTTWLSPLTERMVALLKQGDALHCDETRIQVLKEPERTPANKSYMWVWTTPACESRAIAIFRYHPSRAGEVPRDFLEGWRGYLMTDAYSAYRTLDEGITIVGCMAHVRRRFTDILKSTADPPPDSVSVKALRRIDEMFHVEGTFSGMSPPKRKTAREEQLRPLMEGFYSWLEPKVKDMLPGYAVYGAANYALNQRPYVMNVFEDGRLDLTNNRAERAIRPFAVARRNFLFSDTPKGAEASAALFSIVQTALLNGIKPFEYLTWLLEELPHLDLVADPGAIDTYLPWSDAVPEQCRMPEGQPESLPEEPVLMPPGTDIEAVEACVRFGEELAEAAVAESE
jgi:transposase